jgi:hypothetical protein
MYAFVYKVLITQNAILDIGSTLHACPAVPGGVILSLLADSSRMNVPGLVPLFLIAMFYLYES